MPLLTVDKKKSKYLKRNRIAKLKRMQPVSAPLRVPVFFDFPMASAQAYVVSVVSTIKTMSHVEEIACRKQQKRSCLLRQKKVQD